MAKIISQKYIRTNFKQATSRKFEWTYNANDTPSSIRYMIKNKNPFRALRCQALSQRHQADYLLMI